MFYFVETINDKKNIVDNDSNILYDTYVQYKVWYIIEYPSEAKAGKYKLFIGDSDIEIHTEWEIINSTFQVKTILLIILKNFLKLHLVIHTHTKLKFWMFMLIEKFTNQNNIDI